MNTKTVVITGAEGLLGRHAQMVLLSQNGAARFNNEPAPWNIKTLNRDEFGQRDLSVGLLSKADLVLHFAGVNRASDEEVEQGNREIAERLVSNLKDAASSAHVIFANSIQADRDNPYGRGKSKAADVIDQYSTESGNAFSNVSLPHVFGEGGVPFYNTVTSTLCHQIQSAEKPSIADGAEVELIHAGDVIDKMMTMFTEMHTGAQRLVGEKVSVQTLFEKLTGFHQARGRDEFPSIVSKLDVALFQTLQTAGFPESFITELKQNKDSRGTLFETARGGSGGQTFLSWTHPGVERGNHFHRYKIERFVVVSGEATIKIRQVLDDTVHAFQVSGENPVAIDMPALYSHSIINTGETPLLTMFWAHEIFDPKNPDTWFCPVNIEGSKEVVHNLVS